MATVYDVKIVSNWINYSEEDFKKLLEDAINKIEKEKGNSLQVEIKLRT